MLAMMTSRTFLFWLFSQALLLYQQENTGTWVFSGCTYVSCINLISKKAHPQAAFWLPAYLQKATIF
jgi:hypothetical protein